MGGGTFCTLKGVRRIEAMVEVTSAIDGEIDMTHIHPQQQLSLCR